MLDEKSEFDLEKAFDSLAHENFMFILSKVRNEGSLTTFC